MKKYILNSIFFLSIMLMSFGSYAYDFVIMGNVSDDNGNPVVQQEVFFRTSSNPQDTLQGLSTFTDGSGNYMATINVEGDSAYVMVETYSYICYNYYSELVIVEGDGAEVNFILCAEGNPTECDLFYYYFTELENPFLVYFNPFIEDSIQGTTFAWDFGDGSYSEEAYPMHEYAGGGEYFVTLSAFNDECGEMIYEDVVYVWTDSLNFERCFAEFYFITDSLNENTVHFYDESYSEEGISSWFWEFGDGTTSIDENPIHTYSEEGEYIVTLTIASGDVCTSTIENYIWVGENTWYPEECQAFFFTEYNYNDFLTAQFVDFSYAPDGQINSWQWEFGDGTGSAEQNPAHTYSEEGEYTVTLTIYTDSCTSTFQEVVYMEDWTNPIGDCQAFFYPKFDSIASAVQFYDLSIPNATSWSWEFGDGETSNEQNPYHIYDEVGIYMVSLIAGSDSCSSEFAMEIEIFEEANKSKGISYSGIIRRAFAVHGSGTSGINNLDLDPTYSIYPNPVSNRLNINFNKHVENAQINIMNIAGQTIKRINITNTSKFEMNTSNLPSGIYFARILVDSKISTLKFVK